MIAQFLCRDTFQGSGWPGWCGPGLGHGTKTRRLRFLFPTNQRHNHLENLGGGFKHFLIFIPIWGNDPIFTNIFQMGWFNHQPENGWLEDETFPNWGAKLSRLFLFRTGRSLGRARFQGVYVGSFSNSLGSGKWPGWETSNSFSRDPFSTEP